MGYFKGTREECEAYNSHVASLENYTDSTDKWAEIIEVDGSFYIKAHPKHSSSLEKVGSLPQNTMI